MKRGSGGHISAAGAAALNRSDPASFPGPPPAPRSLASQLRRQVRSACYRVYYGAVIRATPHADRDARKFFLLFSCGCFACVFLPAMALSALIPRFHEMDLKQLERRTVEHGTYYFSPSSSGGSPPRRRPTRNFRRTTTNRTALCGTFGWEPRGAGGAREDRGVLVGATSEANLRWLRGLTRRAPDLIEAVSFLEIGRGGGGGGAAAARPRWRYAANSTELRRLRRSFAHARDFAVDYYAGNASRVGQVQADGHRLRWERDGVLDPTRDTVILLGHDQSLGEDYVRARQLCHVDARHDCRIDVGGKQWSRVGYEKCSDMTDDNL